MPNKYTIDDQGILWGPGVVHDLIPEAHTQPLMKATTAIMHSNASPTKVSGENLAKYMGRADITIECHLIPQLDGTIRQVMPLNRRADCNARANGWAISFETQDEGSPTLADTPWTPAQFESIAGVLAAIALKYGVPLRAPVQWADAGVGYHSQYPEWSIYVGKTCPGAARIAQMPALRARAAVILKDAPAPSELPREEDEMTLYRKDGKSAVWLADRKTRVHVPDVTKLAILEAKYGTTLVLKADTDLETLGQQVLSYTADV